ncbi:MAG: purine-nucleoside phosphorylase [Desulfuromonas sp.]|nr:MAG: purine-nucleoside phosphorylase [Desulfuromonas sp.]
MMNLEQKSAEVLRCTFGNDAEIAVILGSGWSETARGLLVDPVTIPYKDLPGFPALPMIHGHAGELLIGRVGERRVLLFCGRFHLYQGLSAREVAYPVRVAAAAGCRFLLQTNAVGGIRSDLAPGDLFVVNDHINLTGENPLRGEYPPPFVDLTSLYDSSVWDGLQLFADDKGIPLHRGVLAALPGPSYETPAEIRALERLGADVVSMSTVHEAIQAAALKMRTLALSLISNLAAGREPSPLSHQDVLATASTHQSRLKSLLFYLLQNWR